MSKYLLLIFIAVLTIIWGCHKDKDDPSKSPPYSYSKATDLLYDEMGWTKGDDGHGKKNGYSHTATILYTRRPEVSPYKQNTIYYSTYQDSIFLRDNIRARFDSIGITDFNDQNCRCFTYNSLADGGDTGGPDYEMDTTLPNFVNVTKLDTINGEIEGRLEGHFKIVDKSSIQKIWPEKVDFTECYFKAKLTK